MTQLGLTQLIEEDIQTYHRKDHHAQLDQMFANLPALNVQVGDCDGKFSDHSPILVEFLLESKPQEIRFSEGLQRVTDHSIKAAAMSFEFIQHLHSVTD